MRVRVRERPQTVVVLLASGIPEGELDLLAVNLDVCEREGGPMRSAMILRSKADFGGENLPAT